jgi:hypothetical protein
MESRVLHIVRNVSIEDEPSSEDRALAVGMLKTHHVESSSDTFAFLQQIVQLSPGMRLVYRANFAKMYNDISQASLSLPPRYVKTVRLSNVGAV